VDNDCDGLVDDADDSVDTAGFSTYYADADGDGYGNAESTADACDAPSGYTDNGDDCDDMDATVNPESLWYSDVDGDGYGSETFSTQSCEQPSGYVDNTDDCDDMDSTISPDAQEICDGNIDNDCDGSADDADDSVDASTFSTYYMDADTDGYGDAATYVTLCDMPSGYTTDDTDCDDTEILVNPGETEVCNDGLDNDCSGDAPECGLPDYGSPSDSFADLAAGGPLPYYFGATEIISGDFNGDGITDIAVSDYYGLNLSGNYGAGSIEFFYGPISSGSGITADARIEGYASYDYLGYDMVNMGDIDGDGTDEILTGAYQAESSYYNGGMAYVLNGPTSGVSYAADNALTSIESDYTYAYFGHGVAAIGDVNGDGLDDFAVGAAGYDDLDSQAGRMYVFYGSTSVVPQSLADGTAIWGESYYDYIGRYETINGLGDLDGDGTDDWGFSSSNANSYTGEAWIYYGGTSTSWSSTADADATLTGSGSSYTYWGARLDGGDDLDGDGYDDLFINDEWGAYIWSGGSTRIADGESYTIDISDSAQSGYGYFDMSDTQIGDYNGDGAADLTISNYYSASGTGGAWTFNGPLSAGSYDVTDADSSLTGSSTSMYFGRSTGTGDFNGDGAMDLAVGQYNSDAVYLFSGGSM
jgi:hypothetical protein